MDEEIEELKSLLSEERWRSFWINATGRPYEVVTCDL